MIAEGEGCTAVTTTDQSTVSSDSISVAAANLPFEVQSDLSSRSRSVDTENVIAAVVDDIISNVAAAAGDSICTSEVVMTSVASDTFVCRSSHVYSSPVSASADDIVDDDVHIVEVQPNGYYYMIYFT